MKTYNFQKQFAADTEAGLKFSTIRRDGKRPPPKRGERLRFYTGMRTKKCRWIGDTVCSRVRAIIIWVDGVELFDDKSEKKKELSPAQELSLAIKDGFCNIEDFRTFFNPRRRNPKHLFFAGWLIEWRQIPAKLS